MPYSEKILQGIQGLIAFLLELLELLLGILNLFLTMLLGQLDQEMEKNKEKLHSVEYQIEASEKEKTTDKRDRHLEEKQNLLNCQWKLERRKEYIEKLLLNVEKLQQKIENLKRRK